MKLTPIWELIMMVLELEEKTTDCAYVSKEHYAETLALDIRKTIREKSLLSSTQNGTWRDICF